MKYLSHNEIHTQHALLGKTVRFIDSQQSILKEFFRGSKDIVFVACGSSYWMSLSAHRTMKLMTNRRAYAVKAADVVTCPGEYEGLYDTPVFVCPSRSGLTRELLEAVEILKKAYPDCKVFSMVGYPENKLTEKSDLSLNISWTLEKAVCQTRTVSSMYAASVSLAAVLGGDETFIPEILDYLENAPALYKTHEAAIPGFANPLKTEALVTLGCGLQYGLVIAGAYIVVEMAEFDTNFYQLLEYRHGPVVTAKPGTAIFICSGASEEHESKIALEAREAGAKVYAIAPYERDWADYTFSLKKNYRREITALHFLFVLQSFAFHYSVARGKNPDSPGNLEPYITY
jgi:fructoselysine-6-P-deglycase FrlB-like protein